LAVERNIVITNSGNATLTISDIVQSGGDFFVPISRFPGLPINLDPGTATSIPVDFDATAEGPRTGSLDIVDNAPGSPHRVDFTGTGITNDFAYSLTSSPSVTVSAGQPATFTVELVTGSQSSGSVALGATGLPPAATFTLPTGFPVDMHTSQVLDFSAFITTTASQTTAHKRSPMVWAYGILFVFGTFLLAPQSVSRQTTLWLSGILIFMAITVSCGGSSTTAPISQLGTQPGTYSVSLTATIGSTTHNIPVTLIVK